MRAVFVDANPSLAAVMRRLLRTDDLPVVINEDSDIAMEALPALLSDAQIAIVDHSYLPVDVAKRCAGLRHVVFLGTGARSYMDPEALTAECGIEVHTIKGYGDTAVAEMAFALMWAAARGIGRMHHAIVGGDWPRTDGMQLTGKTVGIVGFGGIGAEMARLCAGIGMRVLTWNRAPRSAPDVEFVDLDTLLSESHVVSLHLSLNDGTRGLLGAQRLALMRPDALFVNTARGAIVDETALVEALRSGRIGAAGLDVFMEEPLSAGHPLTRLPNVVLTSHSAFRTPEASDNLIEAALEHCRRIARG